MSAIAEKEPSHASVTLRQALYDMLPQTHQAYGGVYYIVDGLNVLNFVTEVHNLRTSGEVSVPEVKAVVRGRFSVQFQPQERKNTFIVVLRENAATFDSKAWRSSYPANVYFVRLKGAKELEYYPRTRKCKPSHDACSIDDFLVMAIAVALEDIDAASKVQVVTRDMKMVTIKESLKNGVGPQDHLSIKLPMTANPEKIVELYYKKKEMVRVCEEFADRKIATVPPQRVVDVEASYGVAPPTAPQEIMAPQYSHMFEGFQFPPFSAQHFLAQQAMMQHAWEQHAWAHHTMAQGAWAQHPWA